LNLTLQLSFIQRDAYAITWLHARSCAKDRGTVGVPADCVATRQDRERTQRFEASGHRPELRPRTVHSPVDRGTETPVGSVEPALDRGKAPSKIPGLEPEAQRPEFSIVPGEGIQHAGVQLVRQFGCVAPLHREPGREGGEAATAGQDVDTGPAALEAAGQCAAESARLSIDARKELLFC
jgi:hypothetical protein